MPITVLEEDKLDALRDKLSERLMVTFSEAANGKAGLDKPFADHLVDNLIHELALSGYSIT